MLREEQTKGNKQKETNRSSGKIIQEKEIKLPN